MTMARFKFHKGTYVIDKIAGTKGVIVARTDHITGCNNYGIHRGLDKDGNPYDLVWLDEPRLEIDTEKQQLRLERSPDEPPG